MSLHVFETYSREMLYQKKIDSFSQFSIRTFPRVTTLFLNKNSIVQPTSHEGTNLVNTRRRSFNHTVQVTSIWYFLLRVFFFSFLRWSIVDLCARTSAAVEIHLWNSRTSMLNRWAKKNLGTRARYIFLLFHIRWGLLIEAAASILVNGFRDARLALIFFTFSQILSNWSA